MFRRFLAFSILIVMPIEAGAFDNFFLARLIEPGSHDILFDSCSGASTTSGCGLVGPAGSGLLAHEGSNGVTSNVELAADVSSTGKPTLVANIYHTSLGDQYGINAGISSNYQIFATLKANALYFPGALIPLVQLKLHDHGHISLSENIHFVTLADFYYHRNVNMDFTNLIGGVNIIDISGGGGFAPALDADVLGGVYTADFQPFGGFTFHSIGDQVLMGVHLATSYAADSYGGGVVSLNFMSTTSLEGISFFDEQGRDVTGAFDFSLSDGTRLFVSSVPEPSMTVVLFAAAVAGLIAKRRKSQR